MKTVSILEQDDHVESTDWCRPLMLDSSGQDCTIDGHPRNNVKWAPVFSVIPAHLHGQSVIKIRCSGMPYEFVRGAVPEHHKLDMRLYTTRPPKGKQV